MRRFSTPYIRTSLQVQGLQRTAGHLLPQLPVLVLGRLLGRLRGLSTLLTNESRQGVSKFRGNEGCLAKHKLNQRRAAGLWILLSRGRAAFTGYQRNTETVA